MSIFNEILSKINTLTTETNKNFEDDLKNVFESLEKFERDYLSSKAKQRELAAKSKTALKPLQSLQSINEDEDESKKTPDQKQTTKTESKKLSTDTTTKNYDQENVKEKPSRNKKRSKDQVDDMHSPEQDKRPKRNASVRAQNNISRQKPWWQILNENDVVLMSASKTANLLVNQNLTQKLRRDESERESRLHKEQDSDKENTLPIQIKQEKISLPPPEAMEIEVTQDFQVKQEVNKDDVAMPPPVAPVPKRGRAAKAKQKETANESSDESEGKRKSSRSRKQTEAMPPPPVPSKRSTRASSRTHTEELTNQAQTELATRPKRTRTKKVPSQSSQESEATTASAPTSPDKPRPKRTRRGKAAERQQKPESPKQAEILPKEERLSVPDSAQNQNVASPILVIENSNRTTKNLRVTIERTMVLEKNDHEHLGKVNLEETRVISGGVMKEGAICDFDKTVILPNGNYDHVSSTPKAMNETVVITKPQRGTTTLQQTTNPAMDATVVIEKAQPQPQAINMTDDNSLLTDDSDNNVVTPPANQVKSKEQTLSAVKEKVQQFEEMANRVTRTKTRAMAKKEESTENHTPPGKICKVILTADTLTKMNGLIFNGKAPQISSSATKPNIIKLTNSKSLISSASKIPIGRKEEDRKSKTTQGRKEDDVRTKEREDARKKKEAILEAKREYNKRKREEKMAAAAAARSAAERERQLALEAAARDKTEKQAHADMNKQERMLEAEKKKLELNRKAAETEERRRAEERARALRLAEEQRAHIARTKQIEESLASKKEAVLLAKEIEKRQKEYIEKQKLKLKMEADKVGTPVRNGHPPGNMPPVHMADGFEHLNSDNDDDEPVNIPAPWSTHKVRCQRLKYQYYIKPEHIDRLFSVRVHSPDLLAIFPRIERRYLKRTSSAVWRTPPHRAPVHY